MLVRSLRVPPSLLLFVLFCGFLGWHFSEAPLPNPAPPAAPRPPQPASPPAEHNPVPEKEKKKHQEVLDAPKSTPTAAKKPAPPSAKRPLRVALVTFVTEERSYLHISLKSKDRTWHLWGEPRRHD
jgi:mannan polymerase II complex MNN10 subunit